MEKQQPIAKGLLSSCHQLPAAPPWRSHCPRAQSAGELHCAVGGPAINHDHVVDSIEPRQRLGQRCSGIQRRDDDRQAHGLFSRIRLATTGSKARRPSPIKPAISIGLKTSFRLTSPPASKMRPSPAPKAAKSRTYLDEGPGDVQSLREAIAKLPVGQRQAAEMLKLQEMSLKVASAASGQSVAALKVAMHRALKALRTALGEERQG